MTAASLVFQYTRCRNRTSPIALATSRNKNPAAPLHLSFVLIQHPLQHLPIQRVRREPQQPGEGSPGAVHALNAADRIEWQFHTASNPRAVEESDTVVGGERSAGRRHQRAMIGTRRGKSIGATRFLIWSAFTSVLPRWKNVNFPDTGKAT